MSGLVEEGIKLQGSLEQLEKVVNDKGIMVEVEVLEKLSVYASPFLLSIDSLLTHFRMQAPEKTVLPTAEAKKVVQRVS